MFNSNLNPNAPIIHHAMNAFNIDNQEDILIMSKTWGVMVEVLSGDNAGTYDYNESSDSFIAA